MSGQIFISYRRDDASHPAGRLYDRLSACFPQNQIFLDVDSNIPPGADFVKVIEGNVGSCDVLIAVIGKRWLSSADEEGRRRLDDPEDFVRVEVGTALKRGIRVIPVLVDGASMPRSGELPEDLSPLIRRQALAVSHDRFRVDAERLVGAVERALEDARVELQRKREEQGRAEAEGREQEEEERREAERHKTKAVRGIGADSRAPPPGQTPAKEGATKRKKRWRWLVVIGSGAAVCLLGLSLPFMASPRRPVSMVKPAASQPLPSPTASGVPGIVVFGVTPAVGQASLSPTFSGEKGLAAVSTPPPLGSWSNAVRPVEEGLAAASPAYVPIAVPSNSPSSSPSGADWFAEAKRYLDVKDYAKALSPLQKAAEAGNAEAMNQLGTMYLYGVGIRQDVARAREWYQKAADAGDTKAMRRLGYMYIKAFGVAYDYAQGLRWYQKAADRGDAVAEKVLSDPSSINQDQPMILRSQER